MPVFLSTPKSSDPVDLPFRFAGGLALSTKKIGFMLAVQGVYSMIAQLWLFPFVVRHFGTLRTFRFVLAIWPPLYFVVPYLILLPSRLQIPAVYAALISKITLHVIAFPSTAILLANAAPSHTVLGSINGAAASTASLSRAFGPTITGFLHSSGSQSGFAGLSWWACGIVCIIGAIQSFFLEEVDSRPSEPEKSPSRDIPDDQPRHHDSAFLVSGGLSVPEEERRLLSTSRSSFDIDFDVASLSLAPDADHTKS